MCLLLVKLDLLNSLTDSDAQIENSVPRLWKKEGTEFVKPVSELMKVVSS